MQAFSVVVEAAAVAPELRADDPAVSAMAADLQLRPLRRGGRALLVRRILTSERGTQPCPELGLMIVDLKRTYLELRPDLLRVYDTAPADGPLAPTVRALGFAPVASERVGRPVGARDARRQRRRLDRGSHRAGDVGSAGGGVDRGSVRANGVAQRPRAGGPGRAGRRPDEPGAGRAALHQRTHRQSSPQQHLHQARRAEPDRRSRDRRSRRGSPAERIQPSVERTLHTRDGASRRCPRSRRSGMLVA